MADLVAIAYPDLATANDVVASGMALGAATGAATGALSDYGIDDDSVKELGNEPEQRLSDAPAAAAH